MKKIILITAILLHSVLAFSQIVSIPDSSFKANLLLNSAINTNADGEIQVSEAAAYTGNIVVINKGISDLTGIEAFTQINALRFSQNNVTSVNLLMNTSLTYLECTLNQITSLDLTNNTALTAVLCRYNPITTLNISNQTELRNLDISHTDITSIDLTHNNKIEQIICNNSPITNIVNLAGQDSLIDINASMTPLQSLDLSNCPKLRDVYAEQNGNLSTINLSNCDNLRYLYVTYDSTLSTVNFGSSLYALSAYKAGLTSLDLSTISTPVFSVDASYNNLSTFMATSNIQQINLNGNQITSIDVSMDTTLYSLECVNNDLSYLNIANNRNTGIGNFDARVNPNLTCIQVDNIAYADSAWSTDKDDTASFNTYCEKCQLDNSISLSGTTLSSAESGINYQWINCSDNSEITGETGQSFTPSQTGDYACIISDVTNSCIDTSACLNVVIGDPVIDNIVNDIENEISIYPNPLKSMLNISTKATIDQIEILDVSGKLIMTIKNSNSIDVSNLTKGIYYLKLTTSKSVSVRSFIKS